MFNRRGFFQVVAGAVVASQVGLPAESLPALQDWRLTPRNIEETLGKWKTLGFRLMARGGQTLFPVYGIDGGISAEAVLYMVRPRTDGIKDYVAFVMNPLHWGGMKEALTAVTQNFTDNEYYHIEVWR